MKETKKPRGAPKKENPASDLVKFRCTPDEKKSWKAKAEKAGHPSLASWLKKLGNEAEL